MGLQCLDSAVALQLHSPDRGVQPYGIRSCFIAWRNDIFGMHDSPSGSGAVSGLPQSGPQAVVAGAFGTNTPGQASTGARAYGPRGIAAGAPSRAARPLFLGAGRTLPPGGRRAQCLPPNGTSARQLPSADSGERRLPIDFPIGAKQTLRGCGGRVQGRQADSQSAAG
jgi:hypothetical protein